ncbi:hypothetical protein TSOC_009718, partial [Tetrabaena socialis]
QLHSPLVLAALGGWHVFGALEQLRGASLDAALRPSRSDIGSHQSLHAGPAPASLLDRQAPVRSNPDRFFPEHEPQPLAGLGPTSELAAALHHGGLCWEAMAAQHSSSCSSALLQGLPMPGAPRRAARLLSLQLKHHQPQQHPLSWMTQLPALLAKAGVDALGGTFQSAAAAAAPGPGAAVAARLDPPAAGSIRQAAPTHQRPRFWRRHQQQQPQQPLAEGPQAPRELSATAVAATAAAATSSTPVDQAALVLAGAVSRTLAQVVIHPLDTLKTRMQVSLPTPQLQVWRAVMGCPATRGRALVAWAGPAGARDMFLGLGATLAGVLPASAVYFGAEAAVRGWMAETLSLDRESAPCRLVASAAAATLSAFIRVPADVLKHRVQAYAYPSVARAARDILATRGPGGLYTGFSATLLRDAPEIVIQFTAYATLKRLLEERRRQHSAVVGTAPLASGSAAGGGGGAGGGGFVEHVVLGGAAGAAAALATTPLDVVKTQMQCGAASSVGSAVAGVLRAGGPAALLSGLAPRLLQTTICSAIFFTCFEASKARLAAAAKAEKAAGVAPPAKVAMAPPAMAGGGGGGGKQHLRRRRRATSDPAPLAEELDLEAASWGLWESRAELA